MLEDILQQAASDVLAHLGRSITYDGQEITGHFTYEEIEVEGVFQTVPLISVDKSLNLSTQLGIGVVIDGKNYTVKREVLDNSPLLKIQLNNA